MRPSRISVGLPPALTLAPSKTTVEGCCGCFAAANKIKPVSAAPYSTNAAKQAFTMRHSHLVKACRAHNAVIFLRSGLRSKSPQRQSDIPATLPILYVPQRKNGARNQPIISAKSAAPSMRRIINTAFFITSPPVFISAFIILQVSTKCNQKRRAAKTVLPIFDNRSTAKACRATLSGCPTFFF